MKEYKIKEIVQLFDNPEVKGDTERMLSSIAALAEAKPSDLSFLGNKKYAHEVEKSQAGAILLPRGYDGKVSENTTAIFVDDPSIELAKICAIIEAALWPKPKPSIHESAVIDPTAQVAKSAVIGPNAVICANAKIGEGARIQANNYIGVSAVIGEDAWIMPNAVVMDYCEVGKRSRVQPGAIIGSDGYGYAYKDGRHIRIPQVGKVVLEDDVDIGANTTIDRARFDKTVVGAGTKIDNLVQIGHKVRIGKGCLIVSQAGISGSTKLGNFCILGGQVGLVGHIELGDGAKVGAQSGINHDLKPNEYVRGTPAYPFMTAHKLDILKEKLPDMFRRLQDVEKALGIEKKTFSK